MIKFFFYDPMKCYNACYGLLYLQEALCKLTGTNTPEEQENDVSTHKGININKRDKNYVDCVHTMPAHFENGKKCDG